MGDLTENERLAFVEIEMVLRRAIDRKEMTYRDIERETGIAKSQADVIETRALSKLRKLARSGWAP